MKQRIVWSVLTAVVLAASVGCKNPLSPSGQVEYRITGTATQVDVTYANSSGGTAQVSRAAVPWNYSWSTAKTGDFLYVSAQIVNSSGGNVTVTILRNGSTVQTATSSGFATIATASGTY